MKKTLKGALALAFCIVTVFATMLVASAIGAPKAKVGKITYNSVTISWAKVKDADFYEVQRSTDGKKWTTLNKAVKGTSYKDSSKLTAGKSYKYRVRAIEDRIVLSDVYSSWSKTVSAKPVPEKVTSLKAASKTHNSVKLSWKKVSGASGYEVQMLKDGKWKSYKKTTSTSLNVTKLKLGTTYQFRVRAYRTVSKKAIYGAVSSVLKTGPSLKAPSTFVLKGVSTSSLKLAWSSVTGAKGYEVYNTVTKKWTDVKTKKTLTVKNLKAGTKYGFIVRAYSGKYDGTKTATRTYITAPAKVSGVKVTAATDKTVTFSWSKVTGAAGYQPAIYDYAAKKWTNIAATTKTSVTVSKLSGAKKYAVRVRAYVKNSNVKDISATAYGSWSSNVDTYTAPAKVSAVYINKIATTSLGLTWSKSSGATSYEYYNPVSKKWISTGSANSATVSGLSAGTKYTFKVRAKVSNRTSAESAGYSFSTLPTAPTGLKVSNIASSTVNVAWNSVKGASGYQVEYKKTSASSWTKLAATASTSAKVSGLSGYTDYQFRVRAYVKNSNVQTIGATSYGAYSATVSARTIISAPSIKATATSNDTITLSWAAVTGAVGYTVERYAFSKNDWTVYDFAETNVNQKWKHNEYLDDDCNIVTTELSLADQSKNSPRSDVYRVTAIDKDGNKATSASITGYTEGMKVTINDFDVIISVPVTEEVNYYQVHATNPDNTTKLLYEANASSLKKSDNYYEIKLNLDPSSYHLLFVVGKNTSNSFATTVTHWSTIRTKDLKIITSTSDSKYNASVNSQLLYLARAINNTKAYKDEITVSNRSSVSYEISSLKLQVGEFLGKPVYLFEANSPEEVEDKLASLSDDGESIPAKSTEKIDAKLNFKDGKCVDKGTYENASLKLFIEPTSNSTKTAYLHNGLTSQSAWKNGFESVTTKKNSDGSHTIKAVFKLEKINPVYHSGFISSFDITSISGEGFDIDKFDVGKSTVSAVIDSDGYLKSYSANSKFDAKVGASFSSEKDGPVKMTMTMGGTTNFDYTITR